MKIELMDSNQRPLRTIFGKSSTTNMNFHYYSSVLYHNKTPQFGDEIKMKIPIDLNDGHHLQFTFLHISCKHGKTGDVVATPVAYTVSFLFDWKNDNFDKKNFIFKI